jgi:hypothetical protein
MHFVEGFSDSDPNPVMLPCDVIAFPFTLLCMQYNGMNVGAEAI